MHASDVPVLLIPFRRPTKIKRLVEALALVKPKHIYVLGDGPRPNNPEEAKLCAEARRIATDIPWPCTIHTHFKDTNIGLTENVGEGITWFFSQVESGIIFEDDCVPDPSFFSFCAELLERYKDDTGIMHISGNNFQKGVPRSDGSYYYSHYSHSWGWATWRRAWQYYPEAIASLNNPKVCEDTVNALPFSSTAKKFWIRHLLGGSHWDGLWLYTTWYKKGLCILPNQTLVSNIGFDEEATHTLEPNAQSNLLLEPLTTIVHPTSRAVNVEADEYTFRAMFHTPLWKKAQAKVNAIIKKLL